MFTYELLEAGCYYLIQEKEEEQLKLIKLHFKSDYAVCTSTFTEGEEIVWKKKADTIHDIVECLDDKAVAAWEKVNMNSQDFFGRID